MRIMFRAAQIGAVLGCVALVTAQLTRDEEALLNKLLAKQRTGTSRRQVNSPNGAIRTVDGNVVISVGDGNSVAVQIGDTAPVSIADIPAEVQSYSDSNLHSFATGFQTCRANDNSLAVLNFMNQTFLDNERHALERVDVAADLLQQAVQSNVSAVVQSQEIFESVVNSSLEAAARDISAVEGRLSDRITSITPATDGSSAANAATNCRAIRAANASAPSGVYYIQHPDKDEIQYPSRKWGMWSNGHFVLKVYCDFATGFVYNGTQGNRFRIDYDGIDAPVEVTAPARTDWLFHAVGAAGGDDWRSSRRGGEGGLAVGVKSFESKTKLWFYVGGKGGMSSWEDNGQYDDMPGTIHHHGGYNGGGRGTRGGSGGGGASDVRLMKQRETDRIWSARSLNSRIIVGAGGGGCGYGQCQRRGGHGGTTTGESGSGSGVSYGGQQSQGGRNNNGRSRAYGKFGYGGDCDISYTYNDGGGGGGGWYGGSGAATSNTAGGGGSSYVRNLSGSRMTRGGNRGDGYIEFAWKERA